MKKSFVLNFLFALVLVLGAPLFTANAAIGDDCSHPGEFDPSCGANSGYCDILSHCAVPQDAGGDCRYPACSESYDCNDSQFCKGATAGEACSGVCQADEFNPSCSPGTCTNNSQCSSDETCQNYDTSQGPCSGSCHAGLPGSNPGGTGGAGGGGGGASGGSGGINTQIIAKYGEGIRTIINTVFVPTLIAIAFIVFLFGVYRYFIYGADNDDARATGRTYVLWGIIGLVIIFSVWGLVAIVGSTLGLTPGGHVTNYPKL